MCRKFLLKSAQLWLKTLDYNLLAKSIELLFKMDERLTFKVCTHYLPLKLQNVFTPSSLTRTDGIIYIYNIKRKSAQQCGASVSIILYFYIDA